MARRPAHTPPTYIDTPAGILSAGGTLYHTTETMLDEYAGPLLEHEPLASFVAHADVWLDAPRTLCIALLPIWLFILPWPLALAAVLATYVLLALASPALASPLAVRTVRVLANPMMQAAILIVALSLLARQGEFAAVWAGLGAFVLLRVGLFNRFLDPLLAGLFAKLYPLPVSDQVLRAFLIRGAIRHNVQLPGLENLEVSAREAWQRVRRKR